jgi:hypothetical protein
VIDRTLTAAIATVLGNATTIIDRVYGRFFKEQRKTLSSQPVEYSLLISNDSTAERFMSTRKGYALQVGTYEELGKRPEPTDVRFIRIREQKIDNLFSLCEQIDPADQWRLK